MKQNNRKTMTAEEIARKAETTARRLESMRANLARLENRAEEILAKGDNMTAADRSALLHLVNIAYHDSGKIQGCISIDSSAACSFCEAMRKAGAVNELVICGACYAWADAWKEAAFRRHKLNARILGNVLFSVDELKELTAEAAADAYGKEASEHGQPIRFNEDGDTVNVTMARNYLRIAKGRPAWRHGYWYKNEPAVSGGLKAEGYTTREQLPENVRFIHSSLEIGFPVRATWYDDGIFTVFPDEKTTAEAIAAGAWPCNGRKCRECGYHCYFMDRRPVPVHIAEVLRTNKENRARILAAYMAKKARAEA